MIITPHRLREARQRVCTSQKKQGSAARRNLWNFFSLRASFGRHARRRPHSEDTVSRFDVSEPEAGESGTSSNACKTSGGTRDS